MKNVEELIQETVAGLDHFPEAALLFDGQGQILGTNQEARSLFNRPLLSGQDLPKELTDGLDETLARGRRSFSRYQVEGGTVLRKVLRPEYLDAQRPQQPACALLRLETKLSKAVPHAVALSLYRELRDGCQPLAAYLHDPAFVERHQHETGFSEAREQAEHYLFERTLRVANVLLALVGGFGGATAEATVKSLVVEAAHANDRFYESQFRGSVDKMQLLCQGSDSRLTTGSLPRLKTLFAEIFVDVHRWSRSASVLWAEDKKTLGVPAVKIEFGFEALPHTLSHMTSRNEGLGWSVAAEVVLDAQGRMEITPGKPASLCLWLPLALPEGF